MLCIDRFLGLNRLVFNVLTLFFLISVLSSCSTATTQSSHKSGANNLPLTDLRPSEQKLLSEKSPAEVVTLGYIYLENRNLDLARLHFLTALEKNPDYAEAYVGLGKIEMHQANYSMALSHFEHASELNVGLLDAMIGQAQALRFEGKLNAATKKLNDAMVVSPNNIIVLKELAILYDLMGHENLAEPLYNEIIKAAPDVAANHNNLGMNQLVQKRYAEAILSFLHALNINSESDRVKNNLATAYALNGDEDKALKIFTKTVGEAAAYNNVGYLYMTQGRLDDAERNLKRAIVLNPQFYLKAQENLSKVQHLRQNKPQ